MNSSPHLVIDDDAAADTDGDRDSHTGDTLRMGYLRIPPDLSVEPASGVSASVPRPDSIAGVQEGVTDALHLRCGVPDPAEPNYPGGPTPVPGSGEVPVRPAPAGPIPGVRIIGVGGPEKGGNGGSDGGGGNGEDGPESRQNRLIEPSADLLEAQQILRERSGMEVATPRLFDVTQKQREQRARHLLGSFLKEIIKFQENNTLQLLSSHTDFKHMVQAYYEILAVMGCYMGAGLSLKNLRIMLGLEESPLDHKKLRFHEDGRPVTHLEAACGNAPVGQLLRDHCLKHLTDDDIYHDDDNSHFFKNIIATDFAGTFATKARNTHGLNGREVDLCISPEEFRQQLTHLGEVDPADFVYLFQAFDRLENLPLALQNLRSTVREDGGSQFIFGQALPISNRMDSMSPDVPGLQCFDASADMRSRWMEEGLSRAEIIARMTEDLSAAGFLVEKVAECPYQVFSPHIAVARTAEEFRKNHHHLKGHDFLDDELNRKRDRIFQDRVVESDFTETDRATGKVLVLPQVYNLVLFSGHVKPLEKPVAGERPGTITLIS